VTVVNPLNPLSSALSGLGLSFVVVGSTASSARGVPRATMDIDLVIRIGIPHAEKLVSALGSEWYADAQQIRQAIQAGRAFNIIHMPTAWKIDLFPAQSEFHECEMQRATLEPVTIDGETVVCPVSTPEDVLVAKMLWYQDGGQVSDRQWGDIAGIVATNPNLDLEYTRLWAGRLRVTDLLDRALSERVAD
jgi:hypothetical protein